jgi:hypothetical protein
MKTAVEFLIEETLDQEKLFGDGIEDDPNDFIIWYKYKSYNPNLTNYVEKALQMEKIQREDDYARGYNDAKELINSTKKWYHKLFKQ